MNPQVDESATSATPDAPRAGAASRLRSASFYFRTERPEASAHGERTPDGFCYSCDLGGLSFPQDSYIACLANRDSVRSAPFQYSPDEETSEPIVQRAERIAAKKRASEATALRVVVPDQAVRLSLTHAIDFVEPVCEALNGKFDVIYCPRRVHTTRRLSAAMYELLRSAPDVIVLGAGMRDHAVDTRYGQPAIDLDEYHHRLYAAVRTIREDFGCQIVYVLNPPATDTVNEELFEADTVAVAEAYAETAGRIVRQFGGHVVDLRSLYPPNAASPETAQKLESRAKIARAVLDAVSTIAARRKEPTAASAERSNASPLPGEAPHAAEAVLETGQRLRLTGWKAERFFYSIRSLLSRAASDDTDDVEVDSATVLSGESERAYAQARKVGFGALMSGGKLLRNLGGRNENETDIQRYLTTVARKSAGQAKPKALIVGDSIRMRLVDGTGYGRRAYEKLNDKFEIVHIPHNCGGTKATLIFIEDWLSVKPDVVHINAGLHDLARAASGPEYPAFCTIDEYKENVRKVVTLIRASGCRTIIWGTNTPVQEEWHRWVPARKKPKARKIVRSNADIRAYNDASVEVMAEFGIPVTDMFTPLWEAGVEKTLLPDGVHLNSAGAEILGALVAQQVARFSPAHVAS